MKFTVKSVRLPSTTRICGAEVCSECSCSSCSQYISLCLEDSAAAAAAAAVAAALNDGLHIDTQIHQSRYTNAAVPCKEVKSIYKAHRRGTSNALCLP